MMDDVVSADLEVLDHERRGKCRRKTKSKQLKTATTFDRPSAAMTVRRNGCGRKLIRPQSVLGTLGCTSFPDSQHTAKSRVIRVVELALRWEVNFLHAERRDV
jgi:hypothetical protein